MTNRDLDINGPEDGNEPVGTGGDSFGDEPATADDLEQQVTEWLDTHMQPDLPLVEHSGWARLQRDIDDSTGTAELIGTTLRRMFTGN